MLPITPDTTKRNAVWLHASCMQELQHTSVTLAAMDASNDRLAEGREELRGQRGLFR